MIWYIYIYIYDFLEQFYDSDGVKKQMIQFVNKMYIKQIDNGKKN